MEELLNKLIKKGWKPRGESAELNTYWVEGNSICWNRGGKASIRDLVSKESGLWQFVCENGMINANDTPEENAINYWRYNKKDLTEWRYMRNYQYRLIESALKDESELESFILDNIKIDGE